MKKAGKRQRDNFNVQRQILKDIRKSVHDARVRLRRCARTLGMKDFYPDVQTIAVLLRVLEKEIRIDANARSALGTQLLRSLVFDLHRRGYCAWNVQIWLQVGESVDALFGALPDHPDVVAASRPGWLRDLIAQVDAAPVEDPPCEG